MELDGHHGTHWTYCGNIHPGESWAEVRANVLGPTAAVKELVAPARPFGVGLRLSAQAARELRARPGEPERFARALARRGLYVFTINGFPYGPFHGAPIKQAVYRPDWREPARARYTKQLAELLAALLPAGVDGSISTVPGGFRPGTRDPQVRERIAARLIESAADLWRRRAAGGPAITLALEPEPCCMLETTAEAVDFLSRELLGREAITRMVALTGLSRGAAERAIRRHVGVCLDACHAAVEFEDPEGAVDRVVDAGLRLAKVQISSGLVARPVTDTAVAVLQRFADDVYLHQVVARDERGRLHRFLDLPDAIRSRAAGAHRPIEWRVHFHVPVFQRQLAPLSSTWPALRALVTRALERDACSHFEVETYTWEVLPARWRARDLTQSIARELETALALARPRDGLAPGDRVA